MDANAFFLMDNATAAQMELHRQANNHPCHYERLIAHLMILLLEIKAGGRSEKRWYKRLTNRRVNRLDVVEVPSGHSARMAGPA